MSKIYTSADQLIGHTPVSYTHLDDDAGHLGTFAQDLGDFFQFDGFIAKQGEQQAVYLSLIHI